MVVLTCICVSQVPREFVSLCPQHFSLSNLPYNDFRYECLITRKESDRSSFFWAFRVNKKYTSCVTPVRLVIADILVWHAYKYYSFYYVRSCQLSTGCGGKPRRDGKHEKSFFFFFSYFPFPCPSFVENIHRKCLTSHLKTTTRQRKRMTENGLFLL